MVVEVDWVEAHLGVGLRTRAKCLAMEALHFR